MDIKVKNWIAQNLEDKSFKVKVIGRLSNIELSYSGVLWEFV